MINLCCLRLFGNAYLRAKINSQLASLLEAILYIATTLFFFKKLSSLVNINQLKDCCVQGTVSEFKENKKCNETQSLPLLKQFNIFRSAIFYETQFLIYKRVIIIVPSWLPHLTIYLCTQDVWAIFVFVFCFLQHQYIPGDLFLL